VLCWESANGIRASSLRMQTGSPKSALGPAASKHRGSLKDDSSDDEDRDDPHCSGPPVAHGEHIKGMGSTVLVYRDDLKASAAADPPNGRSRSPHDEHHHHYDTGDVADLLSERLGPIVLSEVDQKFHLPTPLEHRHCRVVQRSLCRLPPDPN
jgi:hypothetical protein